MKLRGIIWILALCPGLLIGQITPTDTTKRDSLPKEKEKQVDILTRLVTPDALMRQQPYLRQVEINAEDMWETDETGRMPGYVQDLGSMGKPYRRFRYGLPASFSSDRTWVNPLHGYENVYVVHPDSGVEYYDTRTPYVHVDYRQATLDMSNLAFVVSRNLGPQLNITGKYQRRKTDALYLNSISDHYNIWLSSQYRSRRGRYQMFTTAIFNQLQDQMNGGVRQDQDFDKFFDGRTESVCLDGANLFRKSRDLYTEHHYRLLGDSAGSQRLSLFVTGTLQDYYNEYSDTIVDSTIQAFPFPVLPTFDSLNLMERAYITAWESREGISYRLNLGAVDFANRVILSQNSRTLRKEDARMVWNRYTLEWNGDLKMRTEPFELGGNWKVRQTSSNLFKAEREIRLDGYIGLLPEVEDYSYKTPPVTPLGRDSVTYVHRRRLLRATVGWLLYDRNPSLLNTHYEGYVHNSFTSDPDLSNQLANLIRVGAEVRGRDRHRRGIPVEGNRIALTLFYSSLSRMIWYDSTLTVQQAVSGEVLSRAGMEIRGRIGFGPIWWDNHATLQQPAGSGAPYDIMRAGIPAVHGRSELYYQNLNFSFVDMIRFGVEAVGFTAHYPQVFEPSSQQFIPQNSYEVPANIRLDVLVQARIKKTFIWARLYNSLDQVWTPGYFNTPYYPAWGRSIMFGLRWSFYD